MNQSQEKLKMTTEEYLKFERASEIRHEYYNSEIFAMTGAQVEKF